MDTNMSYFYDAKFERNILTVGQTGCRKTIFVQSLAKKQNVREHKRSIFGSLRCHFPRTERII